MNNAQRGRAALRAWEDSKPDNLFTEDRILQQTLQRTLADYDAARPRLEAFGAQCAGAMDALAKEEDRIGNHPRLERWSHIGERVERIVFHPNHDAIGEMIWGSGITALQAAPGNNVLQNALFYLAAHNGEAGHLCSLACTFGLIRALQQVGSAELQATYLPPLLSDDYYAMQHGAQFLTEVQGGSDVGANAIVATPAADGSWRITGEKWFCSNINAEQFLMTARANPDQAGTRGLGLFLVPRLLPDGTTNGFFIRRLKEKLGTRTLASAEVDFEEAVAYPIGPLEDGFKNAVSLVLNTSRLVNATACAGIMARTAIEASTYACHREAFGQPVARYPLVQEAIADIQSEAAAATASTFALAALLDRIERGEGTTADEAAFRMLVNINKMITAVRGSETVRRGIEVLGGNGAIETFSILPRLYRDMMVLESWEGTHNVLCVQVLRDCARYRLHDPFAAYLHAHIDADSPHADRIRAALDASIAQLESLIAGDPLVAQAHIRRVVERLGSVAQAVFMTDPDLLAHFVNRHLVSSYDPMADAGYLPRIARITLGTPDD